MKLNLNSDNARRFENVIRYGTIAEVNHQKALARVKSGELLTDWLPWCATRAGTTTIWSPPTVGEQVAVFSPSGEMHTGFILMGLFTVQCPSPSNDPNCHTVKFADGAVIEYNQQSHALKVTGINTLLVQASEKVTFDTPLAHFTGDVQIDKTSTANIDHISNGISGHNHTHTQNSGNHYGGEATTTPPK